MPKDSPLKREWLSRSTWPSLIFLMLVMLVSASYTFAHRSEKMVSQEEPGKPFSHQAH